MFKRSYCVVAESEADIYRMMRIAANHHLYSTYKIGVYGNERQHELLVTGNPWDYHKFINEVQPKEKKDISTKGV